MTRPLSKVVFAAFLLAFAARPGGAQTYRSFGEEYAGLIRDARWRFGPLLLFPVVLVRDFGYDDNVYFEGSSGRLVRDYGGTLSPELRVYWPIRGTFLAWVRENPEYAFFLKESHQRALTNSYSAGLRTVLFHRFTLDAEYGRESHHQRVSRELPVPARDTAETWRAGIHFETARRSSLGLSAFSRRMDYRDIVLGDTPTPLSRLFNRRERGLQADLYYQVLPESYLFLIGQLTEYAFDDPSQAYRNAVSQSVNVGLRFPLLSQLRGRVSLGYRRFRADGEGLEPFSGVSGDTSLDYQSGRLVFRLDVRRDLVFSAFEGAGYFVDGSFRGGASLYLTRIFLVDYNYTFGRSSYARVDPAAVPAAGYENGRQDTQHLHSLGFTVRLSERFGLSVAWNASRWASSLPGFDRRRNFIGANLTTRF